MAVSAAQWQGAGKEYAVMKITFFDTKSYDREAFDAIREQFPELELDYWHTELDPRTASYLTDSEAVCAFVNADAGAMTLKVLESKGVKLLLLRCAGFNNVDLEAASACGITVMRVPGYSPEAVAELAMSLASATCRHLHKAYIRVRENNFALHGLVGVNFYGKTAGIIGTGKIGAAMARICRGYGMRVLGFDKYHNPDLDFVEYVTLDELLEQSDLISLHCPLMKETYHIINIYTINKMKDGVILVNTSRGGLIDTDDLIRGIRERKFFGVGLDVYEEEGRNVFENREDDILMDSTTSRLLSFPNVIITSHQGFLTKEALTSIAATTLENAIGYLRGEKTGTELN